MKTNHEQLLTRNVIEFSDMVYVFHELNSVYENQFSMYLDSDGWELFDMRTAQTIIRHDFKHFRQFTSDMRKLKNDIINVGMASIRVNAFKLPKKHEVWSIKSLLKKYPITDKYIFSINLQKYLNYGFSKKIKVVADCD